MARGKHGRSKRERRNVDSDNDKDDTGDDRGTAFHIFDPRSARARLTYAVALGALAWFVVPSRFSATTHALVAGDAACFFILAVQFFIISRANAAETRRRAASYDPGRGVVWIVVILASILGLFASAVVVRQGKSMSSFEGQLHVVLCFTSVVLSWLLSHASFTLRYAHLYYRGEAKGGIDFPGDDDPDDSDFAYLAFTIGMTFQVSDTDITSSEIRRTVLRHGLLSFVFNTVIIASAINLVVGQFN
ncbi:MAG TPA: DUF1345 domain-containing protein [Kofleriaceae bacterium]|nr:DUF1345 domain-containing protein [Kofleriaceae bacterium]